jgi:hypothetical protein
MRIRLSFIPPWSQNHKAPSLETMDMPKYPMLYFYVI